jgi:hypothetical protein
MPDQTTLTLSTEIATFYSNFSVHFMQVFDTLFLSFARRNLS